jgi:hypothetical protein
MTVWETGGSPRDIIRSWNRRRCGDRIGEGIREALDATKGGKVRPLAGLHCPQLRGGRLVVTVALIIDRINAREPVGGRAQQRTTPSTKTACARAALLRLSNRDQTPCIPQFTESCPLLRWPLYCRSMSTPPTRL